MQTRRRIYISTRSRTIKAPQRLGVAVNQPRLQQERKHSRPRARPQQRDLTESEAASFYGRELAPYLCQHYDWGQHCLFCCESFKGSPVEHLANHYLEGRTFRRTYECSICHKLEHHCISVKHCEAKHSGMEAILCEDCGQTYHALEKWLLHQCILNVVD